MTKLLLMLTGGTICCAKQERVLSCDTAQAERALTANFAAGPSPWAGRIEFVSHFALNTLSENMTPSRLQLLLEALRQVDWAEYDGVIVAHGTDTLAFSAALLELALAGIPCPLVLVSANRELHDPRSNGNANFRAACELLAERRLNPGVYAVYRNSDGRIYLHRGCRLQQCAIYSEDFFSADMVAVEALAAARPWPARSPRRPLLYELGPLTGSVLLLHPYPGLDYSRVSLDDLAAVVHTTYHSGTACSDRRLPDDPYGPYSLLALLEHCRRAGLPLLLGPCNASAQADKYDTIVDLAASGAVPVWGLSTETLYAKTLLAAALGLRGEALVKMVAQSDICGEFLA